MDQRYNITLVTKNLLSLSQDREIKSVKKTFSLSQLRAVTVK